MAMYAVLIKARILLANMHARVTVLVIMEAHLVSLCGMDVRAIRVGDLSHNHRNILFSLVTNYLAGFFEVIKFNLACGPDATSNLCFIEGKINVIGCEFFC